MPLVSFDEALQRLKSGSPVALPTETVYGLAAPIDQTKTLQKIFELKGRPLSDPLIVHASNLEMALSLYENPSDEITTLAQNFWPGPLSVVSTKKSSVSDLITAGLPKVAVRIPQSPLFRQLIEDVGVPLAAPSANLFKKVSPTQAEHVLETFPGVDVLDGGSAQVGIESTIYDLEDSLILRPGQVTASDLESVLNKKISYSERLKTPGSEVDHYQTKSPIYVFEDHDELKDFLSLNSKACEVLIPPAPEEAQQKLYGLIREADKKSEALALYFSPDWSGESWFALKNRLKKASTKWYKEKNEK